MSRAAGRGCTPKITGTADRSPAGDAVDNVGGTLHTRGMRTLNAYLSFKDSAREAMTLYQSVLGGSLQITTFADFPQMPHDEAEADHVMHAELRTDDGLVLMGSDTPDSVPFAPQSGVSVSLSGDDEAAMRAAWDALAEGGTVTMPLEPPAWGGLFGMLVDRFGTAWMITVDAPTS